MNYHESVVLSDRFVELSKSQHDRQSFDCGQEPLNTFLQTRALKHQASGISKTMVLSDTSAGADGKYPIRAFYTLSSSMIERETLPPPDAKKLPRYPVPVFVLAQLATDSRYHGSGLGKITLINALERCCSIYNELPAYAIVVDCLDSKAERFYTKYGFSFLCLVNERNRLFISMKTVQQLFSPD